MMAEKVATMRAGAPTGNSNASKTNSSDEDVVCPDHKTRLQAAKDLDVSSGSIDRARYVRKHGTPELIE